MDGGVVLCKSVIARRAFLQLQHDHTDIPYQLSFEVLAGDCNLGRASTLSEAHVRQSSAIKTQRLGQSVEQDSIRCCHSGRRKSTDRYHKAEPGQ
jgi:hypothetical protein